MAALQYLRLDACGIAPLADAAKVRGAVSTYAGDAVALFASTLVEDKSAVLPVRCARRVCGAAIGSEEKQAAGENKKQEQQASGMMRHLRTIVVSRVVAAPARRAYTGTSTITSLSMRPARARFSSLMSTARVISWFLATISMPCLLRIS